MSRAWKNAWGAVAMSLFVATTASGQTTVLIDLGGQYSHPGSQDSNGRYWNTTATGVPAPGVHRANMIDTLNNATTIDLVQGADTWELATAEGTTSSTLTDFDAEATQDGYKLTAAGPVNTTAHMRLEGLAADKRYHLTFYGSRGGSGRNLTVTITGASSAGNRTFDTGGENWVIFQSVTPDGGGAIDMNFSTANYPVLSVIKIDEVPIVAATTPATVMVDMSGEGINAPAADSMGRYWNTTPTSAGGTGTIVANAVATNNASTDISFIVTDAFVSGYNNLGTTSSALVDWDAFVTSDSYYIGGGNNAAIRITGLSSNMLYHLTCYGSRNDGNNRPVTVTIGGVPKTYQADFEGKTTFFNQTTATGYIDVSFTSSGFGYVGAIVVQAIPIPSPAYTTVLIDLGGQYPHPGGQDSNGRNWNTTATAVPAPGVHRANMIDTLNNATTIDLVQGADTWELATAEGTTSSTLTDFDAEGTQDGYKLTAAGPVNTTAHMRLEGLAADKRYHLTFYGSRGDSGRDLTVTITNGSFVVNKTFDTGGENWVIFQSVTPDGSGAIDMHFSTANYPVLSVIKIEEVSIVAANTPATIMVDMSGDGATAPLADSMGRYWNTTPTSGGGTGVIVVNAVATNNASTDISFIVTDAFISGQITAGTSSSALVDWDGYVTSDSYFIGGGNYAAIRITGLPSGMLYDLTFYGSRNDGNNRPVTVTIGGVSQTYQTDYEGMTTFSNLKPDASGHIDVTFTSTGFGYVGAVVVDSVAVQAGTMIVLQ